ncbi:cytochrome d ubiquinol oxidase subunit II [Nonomuraea sp. NBC_01738]|uniref:cytochrome d ubiquinol oxidase subunit II n=1 Tax=Nonomuraea sp. NBC_01738 TaxID=2976003 RepID=UPI002E14A86B|nr:cytochrome d ubiquinol oxidase subunit II [Nonomuraea sp. NBC_01738]
MEPLWLAVFAILLIGYFALEGFDLGVGLLLFGKPQAERDRMVAAMAPFVLANEVWLVAVAGALFGVFPALEGPVLFGLYPVVVIMVLSWVVRDAGLWFRRRVGGPRWRSFWDALISLGSLGLAFGWGPALYGSAVHGSATGSWWHPVGVALGAVVTVLFLLHGRAFLGWRAGTRKGGSLALSGLVAAAPVIALLALATPYLMEHTAPASTLNVLSFMVLPFAPVMVGAQVWVWRTFRRAGSPSPSFF